MCNPRSPHLSTPPVRTACQFAAYRQFRRIHLWKSILALFAQHRFCELIGAARLFKPARVACKFRRYLFGGHAVTEFCNGFQITAAAAGKYYIRDASIIAFCKADRAGACPLRFKRYFFHSIISIIKGYVDRFECGSADTNCCVCAKLRRRQLFFAAIHCTVRRIDKRSKTTERRF